MVTVDIKFIEKYLIIKSFIQQIGFGASIKVISCLFQVAGAALLAAGVLLKLKNNDIQSFIPDKYHLGLPPILLIILGSTIFVTSFFGCCGAIRENTCMLTTVGISYSLNFMNLIC